MNAGVKKDMKRSVEEAIADYQTEKKTCEAQKDTIGAAIACRCIGECYVSLEQYEEALQFQSQHLSLAQDCNNQVETQRALATIGRTYLCQAETQNMNMKSRALSLATAEKMFLKALDVCLTLTDSSGLSLSELGAMKGRLFLNLGLVCDAKGLEKETTEFLKKALSISERYCLDEEQYLCHWNLAVMYLRCSSPQQALHSLQLALTLAHRLQDQEKEKEVFIQMAYTNLFIGDTSAAKHFLKKSFKIPSSSDDSARIVKLFKAASALEEAKGISESVQDDTQMFSVHEKLGDAFSEAGIYTKAIVHYQEMLNCGKRLGFPAEQLIPSYVSLAQTYADNFQPDLAIANYHMELELRTDDYEQKCRTWLNIAQQEEFRGDHYRQISKSYMSAFSCAKKANNPKLQQRVLKSLMAVQTSFRETKHLEQTNARLATLRARYSLESDSDESDDEAQLSDIAFSRGRTEEEKELMDLTSSDEDPEDTEAQIKVSARTSSRKTFKVNEKGETPLHVACIKGNVKRVRTLLSEGHQVNVRDNCGWTPLHEAANHDYRAVVELLLEAGADVNDRGGQLCNGITPLIDAASCGNMDIMQLLVHYGANILAKDAHGSTALDCLKAWYSRTAETLEQDDILQYKATVELLQGGMKSFPKTVPPERESHHNRRPKSGHSSGEKLQICETVTCASVTQTLQNSPTAPDAQEHEDTRERNGEEHWRQPLLQDIAVREKSATETYRNTILSLGSSAQRATTRKQYTPGVTAKRHQHRPSLVDQDQFVDDDWLIHDVQQKKRKMRSGVTSLLTSSATRKQMAKHKFKAGSSRPSFLDDDRNSSLHANEGNDMDLADAAGCMDDNALSDFDIDDVDDTTLSVSPPILLPASTALDDKRTAGGDSRVVSVHTGNVDDRSCLAKPATQESTHLAFGPAAPVTRIKVKIADSLILIPLPSSGNKTMAWLSEEASQRFSSHHGRRPLLTFSSADGAILSPEDVITEVLSLDEQLEGVVQGWDQPLLSQRYSQTCRSLNAARYKNIYMMLKDAESSHVLHLRGLTVRPSMLLPLSRTLQGQTSIRELHLPGSSIGDKGMDCLVKVLGDLSSLQVLNLAGNNITATGLQYLAGILTTAVPRQSLPPGFVGSEARHVPLQVLTSLDMSNNPLGYGSNLGDVLREVLCGLPSLTSLSLAGCHLTPQLFQHNRMALSAALKGSRLQELDVSQNGLEVLGVELLLRSLQASQLSSLSLGHTMVACNHLASLLHPFLSEQGARLQSLSLEGCLQTCQNEDLNVVCRLPVICCGLQKLRLSFNKPVTWSTLLDVLSSSTTCPTSVLQELTAVGCSLNQPMALHFSHALQEKLACGRPLRQLTFSCHGLDQASRDAVSQLWTDFWGSLACVSITGPLISLTLKKTV